MFNKKYKILYAIAISILILFLLRSCFSHGPDHVIFGKKYKLGIPMKYLYAGYTPPGIEGMTDESGQDMINIGFYGKEINHFLGEKIFHEKDMYAVLLIEGVRYDTFLKNIVEDEDHIIDHKRIYDRDTGLYRLYDRYLYNWYLVKDKRTSNYSDGQWIIAFCANMYIDGFSCSVDDYIDDKWLVGFELSKNEFHAYKDMIKFINYKVKQWEKNYQIYLKLKEEGELQ